MLYCGVMCILEYALEYLVASTHGSSAHREGESTNKASKDTGMNLFGLRGYSLVMTNTSALGMLYCRVVHLKCQNKTPLASYYS